MDNLKKEIISKLSSGRATLFLGAGFSVGAKNLNNRSPLMAKQLSEEIANLAGVVDDRDDLGYTSDILITNHKNKISDLIDFLKKEYTIKETSNDQNIIASIPWRRVYTTNYDQVFENACKNNDIQYTSIDMDMKTSDYFKQKNTCIHINGFIDNLKNNDLNSKFKLSNSSYVSSDSFIDSDWYGVFKKDLESSSLILFIGYSLYDIDIEKILFDNEDFKEKTYFIVGESCSERQRFKLSKYGKVIEKNIDFLSNLICENKSEICTTYKHNLSAFELYEFIDDDDSDYIGDDMINDFLVYGKLNKLAIQRTILKDDFRKYSIYREYIKEIFDLLNRDHDIVFALSDFCNGKSVLCEQLAIFFLDKDYLVYKTSNFLDNVYDDLVHINSQNKPTIVIIDDYVKLKYELKEFFKIKSENIKIFLTARTAEHLRFEHDLELPKNIKATEFDIDYLVPQECQNLVHIFDNLGAWGKDADLSNSRKNKKIENDYDNQISLALTELLKSEVIKKKTEEMLSEVFNVFNKKTIFYICVFQVMGADLDRSLLSELVNNNEIYDSSKIKNDNFMALFSNDKKYISGKSGLFCAWMIKNFFSPKDIMDGMNHIAKYFDNRRIDFHNSYERDKIFKSSLRFSFIERILPENNKRDNLKLYYDKLKNDISWLKDDPHYWLQYAMAFMTFPDKYKESQQFLDQAYALAGRRYNYSIENIDNQQARLYIKQARTFTDGRVCFDYFKKAHNLLKRTRDDIYKFRQMREYYVFYQDKFHILSKSDKKEFLDLIRQSVKSLESNNCQHKQSRLIDSLKNIIDSNNISDKDKVV